MIQCIGNMDLGLLQCLYRTYHISASWHKVYENAVLFVSKGLVYEEILNQFHKVCFKHSYKVHLD